MSVRVVMVKANFVEVNPDKPGKSLQEKVNNALVPFETNGEAIVGFNVSGGPGEVFVATLFVDGA